MSGRENLASPESGDLAATGDSTPKQVTAAATLSPGDNSVHGTLPGSGTYAIKLPPVAESKGQRVFARAIGSGGTITFADFGDGLQALTATTLTAAQDWVLYENIAGVVWDKVSSVET